jgi:hypothetical protein
LLADRREEVLCPTPDPYWFDGGGDGLGRERWALDGGELASVEA